MFCTRMITHEMPTLVRQLNNLNREVEKFLYPQIRDMTLPDGERVVCALGVTDIAPHGRMEGGLSSRFFVEVSAKVCARALAVGDVVDVVAIAHGKPRGKPGEAELTNVHTADVAGETVIIRDFPAKCACNGRPTAMKGVRVRLTSYDATNREWTATSRGPFLGFACCVLRERRRERGDLFDAAEESAPEHEG
jgi:hypothetical protein